MGGSSSKPKPKPAPAAKPAPPAAPKKPALLDSAVATTQVATRTTRARARTTRTTRTRCTCRERRPRRRALRRPRRRRRRRVRRRGARLRRRQAEVSGDAEAIAGCFQVLHTGVCAEKGVDASESGAVVVVYDSNDAVLVGNAGDSKAVIGRGASGATGDGNASRRLVLTSDHYRRCPPKRRGLRRRRRARHRRCAARCAAAAATARPPARARARDACRATPPTAHRRALPLGRARRHARGSPGRAAEARASSPSATRSLPRSGHLRAGGDEGGARGGDRRLIVASSGVWKVFSPADAVEVVLQHGDAAAAEAIVVEARKWWDELWQGANTTVAVVVFASRSDPWSVST